MSNFSLSENEKQLVEKNIKLAYWKAYKWAEKVSNNQILDDFVSCCEIGLVKAAHSYDVSKNINFATYANACMDNQIKLYLRKNFGKELPFSAIISQDSEQSEQIEKHVREHIENGQEEIACKIDLNSLIKKLSDREQSIISLYYIKYLNEYEIAGIIGISQSYISRIRRRALKKLKAIILSKEL